MQSPEEGTSPSFGHDSTGTTGIFEIESWWTCWDTQAWQNPTSQKRDVRPPVIPPLSQEVASRVRTRPEDALNLHLNWTSVGHARLDALVIVEDLLGLRLPRGLFCFLLLMGLLAGLLILLLLASR